MLKCNFLKYIFLLRKNKLYFENRNVHKHPNANLREQNVNDVPTTFLKNLFVQLFEK